MMRSMRRNLCIFENNDSQEFQQILLDVGVGGSQNMELLGMGGDFADPAFLKHLILSLQRPSLLSLFDLILILASTEK